MEITYHGLSSFKIKGKSATVVTDPINYKEFAGKIGTGEIHVTTISSGLFNKNTSALEGVPLEIPGPGEYEVRRVRIIGLNSTSEGVQNTAFHFEVDGVKILHLGFISKKLTQKEIESLGPTDILLVPCPGGEGILSAKDISELIATSEPSYVIPYLYESGKFTKKENKHLGDLSVLMKELGKEGISPLPKLSTTKDKLPDETQFIVLDIS